MFYFLFHAFLVLMACSGLFLFVAVGVALWMARTADGGSYCLWRFSLIYDRQGSEPWPGMGYRVDLDGDEVVRQAGEVAERMAES